MTHESERESPWIDDVELMRRVRRGDLTAFAQLVERHKAAVYTYLVRMVGDETEAEDLAQMVFLQIFRSARRYKPTAKFTTWLFTIARHLCLNELRRRKRHAADYIEDLHGGPAREIEVQLPDPRPAMPDSEVLKAEFFQMLEKALSQLPENQRTAIILFSQQGLSYEEIACVLGCSVQATKSIIHRARLYLREVLKRYLRYG